MQLGFESNATTRFGDGPKLPILRVKITKHGRGWKAISWAVWPARGMLRLVCAGGSTARQLQVGRLQDSSEGDDRGSTVSPQQTDE